MSMGIRCVFLRPFAPLGTPRTEWSYVICNKRRRARNRFVSALTTNSRCAFFSSPRYRTFAKPNTRLITPNTCSTLARTLDLVRFFARCSSLNGRWRRAFSFLDMFGDPASNPKGWPVVELGKLLAEAPTLGTMAKPTVEVARWLDLRVANIQNGQLTLADKKWLELPDEQVARFALRPDDILLARAIGSLDHLGKAIIVEPDGDWTFDSHLMRVRLSTEKLLPIVFKAFLESGGGRKEFLKYTRRSAVQFNINGKELRKIRIPVPPIVQQYKFATKVEAVRAIATQQTIALATAQATFDALLHQSFRR